MPPNVLVAYTKPPPRRLSERLAGCDVWWADVSSSEVGYWAVLDRCWRHGETFVNVEHDIIPPEGAVRELFDCPESWCAIAYRICGEDRTALGCTKLGAAMMAKAPGLWRRMPSHHWSALDCYLRLLLDAAGFVEHVHDGVAEHLSEGHRTGLPDGIRPARYELAVMDGGVMRWRILGADEVPAGPFEVVHPDAEAYRAYNEAMGCS